MKRFRAFVGAFGVLCAAMTVLPVAAGASGGGGGTGGGGSQKTVELRVTGYVTAIDYDQGLITIGQSYYGNGTLYVVPTTKISLDNVGCDFSDIRLGVWAEARYDPYTRSLNKLTCTTLPTP